MDGYLSKPIDPEMLFAVVEQPAVAAAARPDGSAASAVTKPSDARTSSTRAR